MGIAASQARYLYLTARQTCIEFEGQQINQARTNLANEEAGLFREMLEIEAPVVPTLYTVTQQCQKWAETSGPQASDYPRGEQDSEYIRDMSIYQAYVTGGEQEAYNVAMDAYNAANQEYEKAMNTINTKSADIWQQDQILELKLRQLDTEQETIVNELESVKKVLDKNIENVFKTFQS